MKANCHKCKYFYITYDKNIPYGCKAYGLKTVQIPTMAIKKANDGVECIGFSAKDYKSDRKSIKETSSY